MDATSLALFAVVLLALSFAIHHVGKPTPLPLIPHNNLKWFVGDIHFIAKLAKEKGTMTHAFDDTALRLGPVSQVVIGLGASWISRTFGLGQVIVILADSQEMHDLLVNRAAEFDRSKLVNNLFAATLPQGMLALPTDQRFKHHKRYLGITMTNPYLARMTPRIMDRMQELVDLWSVAAKRLSMGSSTEFAFNALDDIRLSSIDVIASITFGTSFDGVKASLGYLEGNPSASPSSRPTIPKLVADLEVLLNTIGNGIFFPVSTILPWWTRTFNYKWHRALTSTHGYLRSRLHSARANYEAEYNKSEKPAAHKADNVLDIILERERGDQTRGTKTLTGAEIIDELTTFALGGSETTAAAMQWSVKILCKHPAVQYKLRTELLTNLPVINTRPPTYTEITDDNNLPYLSAVMYEILRCSRIAAAIDRDATCDTTLLGYPIPKGTRVLMPIGMVQQLESDGSKDITDGLDSVRSASSLRGRKTGYWSASDAHLFKPERWLCEDGSFNAIAGPWLPFSYGFRGCFGQKLALLELRLFLATTQLNFFFDALPDELNGWKSHETVTNHPVQCYVRPIPWDDVNVNLFN
ncbi:Cytochrome P450 [Mycena venus]|uniref:Cytochrome P450 n=1 Tax=Mycena venus TaxID=2733690 RepID=A0A8H6YYV7_9AGAR|nr:Cytochrome P450 [Mycena venus]